VSVSGAGPIGGWRGRAISAPKLAAEETTAQSEARNRID